MECIKRQRENYHFPNNKKRKIQILTTTDNDQLLTYFEDLSNDLFYEIFDYLDHYDIYQAFLDLNKRFQDLLLESSYPLKINLSSISISNLVYYYNRIIHPNAHRIRLFHITNFFLANELFSQQFVYYSYPQVETLILKNILYENLMKLLTSIKYYFPKLSSLVVNIIDEISSTDSLYSKIYSISALNYCQLTFQLKYNFDSLFFFLEQQTSSMKSFILNTSFYLHNLDLLLSYLPNLHYLSINYLDGSRLKRQKTHSTSLKSLKKLNLKVQNINFNQFEQLILDCFPSIEILYLSVDHSDRTYLNARQWEQLITNHMKNLKIFDFQYTSIQRAINSINTHHLMEEFVSLFWLEHQWFFNNQCEKTAVYHKDFFYSANPYRRHDYTFYWGRKEKLCLSDQDTNFDKVKYLCISDTRKNSRTKKYFSNVTELTIDTNSILTKLNSIINLSKITKLIIKRNRFPFKQLIELLSVMIHLNSLKVSSLLSDDENELFEKVSNTNMIKTFVIDECCTLKKVQLLMNLFPCLQELTTSMKRKEFLSIMTFLLTKMKYLCFLCVLNTSKVSLGKVNKLIEDTKIIDVYEINHVDRKLYLWW